MRNYPSDNTAVCSGDSGGPLVAAAPNGSPVEIGITSFGPADCDTTTADYFTSVTPLSSWVTGWIHTLAPQPPPLPTMSLSAARSYVQQVLAGVLTTRFQQRHAYKTSCSRQTASRLSCGFTFSTGPNDYYGNVVVYYVIGQDNRIYWTDQYLIHWVNDYCYFHSGHRNRCTISTRTGSW